MTLRFSPARREQMDALKAALGLSYVELFEQALDALEEKTRGGKG